MEALLVTYIIGVLILVIGTKLQRGTLQEGEKGIDFHYRMKESKVNVVLSSILSSLFYLLSWIGIVILLLQDKRKE